MQFIYHNKEEMKINGYLLCVKKQILNSESFHYLPVVFAEDEEHFCYVYNSNLPKLQNENSELIKHLIMENSVPFYMEVDTETYLELIRLLNDNIETAKKLEKGYLDDFVSASQILSKIDITMSEENYMDASEDFSIELDDKEDDEIEEDIEEREKDENEEQKILLESSINVRTLPAILRISTLDDIAGKVLNENSQIISSTKYEPRFKIVLVNNDEVNDDEVNDDE